MGSTFFGLNIGASALSTYQTAVNTTANNIANVRTEGYTKQNTEISASAALRMHAKYGSVGTGVTATEITQSRNFYYDTKYWENNSSYGLYSQKLYYLDQIQSILADDDAQSGFSTIFNKMFNGLDSLITDGPSDSSARNQFINQSQSLCTYFNALYDSMQGIQNDCNEEIKASVDELNSMSLKIALLNKEIYALEVRGGKANDLRDQRNSLIDEMSKLVKVETEEVEVYNSNGENLGVHTYRVYANGQILVDAFENREIEVVSSKYTNNQCDVSGMYSVAWKDTGMPFSCTGTNCGGTLKALFQMRDGNNDEALKGTVSATSYDDSDPDDIKASITLNALSNTNLKELSIADKGKLEISGNVYYYSSYEVTTDADGNVSEIKFNLSKEFSIDEKVLQAKAGKHAVNGESVDAMGVPYYMAQINTFIRNFSEMFNQIEAGGQTNDGSMMGSFFTATTLTGIEYSCDDSVKSATFSNTDNTYLMLTAETFKVNAKSLKDPNYFSTTADITNGKDAYDIVTTLKTLQKGVVMFRGDNAEKFLETLISDASVDTNKNEIFNNNYANLANALDKQRQSVAGVDEDEEAMDLVRFQNAYNLASKVISVMSELYDKLINETGV